MEALRLDLEILIFAVFTVTFIRYHQLMAERKLSISPISTRLEKKKITYFLFNSNLLYEPKQN